MHIYIYIYICIYIYIIFISIVSHAAQHLVEPMTESSMRRFLCGPECHNVPTGVSAPAVPLFAV